MALPNWHVYDITLTITEAVAVSVVVEVTLQMETLQIDLGLEDDTEL